MIKTFTATRVLTKGNLLFRDKIIVDTTAQKLTYRKRNPIGIGQTDIVLYFKDIVSFQIITRLEFLLFCNIRIETIGGRQLIANGFTIKDAKEIQTDIGY